MIRLRHQQPLLWHRGLAKDIEDLWKLWMQMADELLEDEKLLDAVYEAARRTPGAKPTPWTHANPAEVVLRLLLLKHIRNWSYDTLEREVRANLVYRAFTRIGDETVPDAKTLARLGQSLGPEVIEKLHRRVVALAQKQCVIQGRKLRVDTTVVETNIYYPTDSSLLGDGMRVLARTMKKIEAKSGGLKRKVRDRMRSIRKRVVAIALSTRLMGEKGEERRKRQYRELLGLTRKVMNQAQRVFEEVDQVPRLRRRTHGLRQTLETMMGRVRRVVKQTKIRILGGVTKSQEKIVSVFEPHTVIIRKGKTSKPTEFGKLIKIQEAALDLSIALDIAVRAAAQNTGATSVAIALMDKDVLVCRARLGPIAPNLGVALNVSTGISRACVRSAQVLNCHDTEIDGRVDADVCRSLGIRSILVIPILVDGAVAGILEVLSDRPGAFTPSHVRWLETVATFVRVLACGPRALTDKPNLRSETAAPSKLTTESEDTLGRVGALNTAGGSVEQTTGITALREVLDKTSQNSSWDDICEQLVSQLQNDHGRMTQFGSDFSGAPSTIPKQ